ncbi:MAG: metal-dependent transcriptional regulator [Phycisphaerae bacterium]
MVTELSSTLEDYLRAVHRIEDEQRVARPRDIARAQKVAASTVTAALQSLAEKGLINYEPYGLITLTEQGRAKAEQLADRHLIIKDFLEKILGLEPERAETTACGMEHVVDAEGLERFLCFVAFMERHCPAGSKCLKDFRHFIKEGANGRTCQECLGAYRKARAEDAAGQT